MRRPKHKRTMTITWAFGKVDDGELRCSNGPIRQLGWNSTTAVCGRCDCECEE
jgi:hypothetical protein